MALMPYGSKTDCELKIKESKSLVAFVVQYVLNVVLNIPLQQNLENAKRQ